MTYYLIWRAFFPTGYDNFPLRALAAVIALGIVFYSHWPESAKRYVRLYWTLGLTYILPFFFTYMLLKNAEANVAAGSSSIWPMSMLCALVILVMLINDALLIALMFIGGSIAAWALFYFEHPGFSRAAIETDYFYSLPIFIFLIVMGTIYNRRRETIQQEKLAAMSSVGNNIAHELRTPLLGIRSNARGLADYLPRLLHAYDLARKADLPVEPIRRRHLASIAQALERIDNETDSANTFIDMLLVNAGDRVRPADFQSYPARECVESALSRYPFNSERERELVRVDADQDFKFVGSDLLFEHVIFNLLKNSLYFIAKAGNGEIVIQLRRGTTTNSLIFIDTGTGIEPDVLPRIFEQFYTSLETGRGSGIGLSFCRRVMDGFGGSIACESTLGEFTKFTLNFPTPPTLDDSSKSGTAD